MIEIRDLAFHRGEQVIFEGLDLHVAEGEVLSVIGPSGCGKTTLLKCLAGLDRPSAGSIFLNLGEDDGRVDLAALNEERLNEVRREIGMVFQYAALFDSLSVRENVAFPMYRFWPDRSEAEIDAEVRRLLAQVGLPVDTTIGKMPAELSGGMRKRVGLARSLALQPRVLLYDEPSSGLDPISAASIDRLILSMRDQVGVTSVVVSHHVANVLRTSDSVAMLYGGGLIAVGPPDEIAESADERVRQFITGSAEGPLTDID
ncbi:MAG TPA: ABC transporter ATP-binding protein [Armatimonadetes bacterium]|nr:ABC transporter ATP-binding protein [Armatimonadota bacterium]